MKFSPEIERDLYELEEKMRKRAAKKTVRRRLIMGGIGVWLAIVGLIVGDGLTKGTVPYILDGVVIATSLLGGFTMLVYGFISLMKADENGVYD